MSGDPTQDTVVHLEVRCDDGLITLLAGLPVDPASVLLNDNVPLPPQNQRRGVAVNPDRTIQAPSSCLGMSPLAARPQNLDLLRRERHGVGDRPAIHRRLPRLDDPKCPRWHLAKATGSSHYRGRGDCRRCGRSARSPR